MTEIPQVSHNKPVSNTPEYEGEPADHEAAPFPEQQNRQTAIDAYPSVLKEIEPEKKSRLKLTLGIVAVGVAGIALGVAVAAGVKGGEQAHQDTLPTNPGVSGELVPGSTTVSIPNTADTYGASPERSVTERVRVNGKDYSIDEAREQLFTINVSDAPTFDAATTKYLAALQTAMNMNTDRNTLSDAGNSIKAVTDMNMDLLTGSDGIMLGLGADHNKVSTTGQGKWLQPGTVAYQKSVENITNERSSELVTLADRQITGNEAGYMLRQTAFITQKEQGSGAALDSVKYRLDIRGKIDSATGTWDFSGSVLVP